MSYGGRKRAGRRRGDRPDRYLALPHYMLNSRAWKSLTAIERALFVEVAQRYNGQNNGEIGLGVREAGEALHIRPQTAGRAFQVLVAKGFLRIGRDSAFNVKSRLAREWIVTLFPFRDEHQRNDFMRWRPEAAPSSPSEIGHPQHANGGADQLATAGVPADQSNALNARLATATATSPSGWMSPGRFRTASS